MSRASCVVVLLLGLASWAIVIGLVLLIREGLT